MKKRRRNYSLHTNNIKTFLSTELRNLGFKKENFILICDPGLIQEIDNKSNFKKLLKEGLIREAPKEADNFVLNYALRYEFCWIVSMDKFRDYYWQIPVCNPFKWIRNRKLEFLFDRECVSLSPSISKEKICELIAKNYYEDKHRINSQKGIA